MGKPSITTTWPFKRTFDGSQTSRCCCGSSCRLGITILISQLTVLHGFKWFDKYPAVLLIFYFIICSACCVFTDGFKKRWINKKWVYASLMQISEQNLKDIESEIREIRNSLPIYFTRMAPSCFFEVENVNSEIPLTTVCNSVLLCVSAIGSADAFAQGLRKVFLQSFFSHLLWTLFKELLSVIFSPWLIYFDPNIFM